MLQISAFLDNSPQGFGLVQRKREFDDYEDDENLYERRPSAWVEPLGEWGPGHVELVEIPSDNEINDNIVAYWQPGAPVPAGGSAEYSYRIRFTTEPLDSSLARAVGTRVGRSPRNEDRRSFVIDFKGEGEVPDDLELDVSSSGGAVSSPRGHGVPQAGVYRAMFELDPQRENLVELRVTLHSSGKPWSETWLYRWSR
jgi:glucans biosynthesis protein